MLPLDSQYLPLVNYHSSEIETNIYDMPPAPHVRLYRAVVGEKRWLQCHHHESLNISHIKLYINPTVK